MSHFDAHIYKKGRSLGEALGAARQGDPPICIFPPWTGGRGKEAYGGNLFFPFPRLGGGRLGWGRFGMARAVEEEEGLRRSSLYKE